MVKPDSRPAADEPAWWFVISSGELLFTSPESEVPVGCLNDLTLPDLTDYPVAFIGELRERSCYLVVADHQDPNFAALGEFRVIRELVWANDEELFAIAARAKQVAEFMATHRFCGRCGTRMQAVDWELAMQCQQCKHRCYPRISPCIIVAITKTDEQGHPHILLARGKHHPEGLYSVLAGFVETGESLEQALAREVMEEAGIQVKNIRYVKSQPWPFPHSLMCGFTAEWESGTLHIDPIELEAGQWFPFDQLPIIPREGTIAHSLIQAVNPLQAGNKSLDNNSDVQPEA